MARRVKSTTGNKIHDSEINLKTRKEVMSFFFSVMMINLAFSAPLESRENRNEKFLNNN